LKKKIYHVHLDKNLTKADMDQIAAGVQLEDGEIHADAISYTDDFKKDQVGIEIHSGKNRIVRRIFPFTLTIAPISSRFNRSTIFVLPIFSIKLF